MVSDPIDAVEEAFDTVGVAGAHHHLLQRQPLVHRVTDSGL
ncbi:hypothetical protein NKDENANG_02117 [Candidatus Entotheonellaceae bacterium PAL068K]